MAGICDGVSELEWKPVADLLPPKPTTRGHSMPYTPSREVVNAMLYILLTGGRRCASPCGSQGAPRAPHTVGDAAGRQLSMRTTPADGDKRTQPIPLLEALPIRTGTRGRPRTRLKALAADTGAGAKDLR